MIKCTLIILVVFFFSINVYGQGNDPIFPVSDKILLEVWEKRPDLQTVYPEVEYGDYEGLKVWAVNYGWNETKGLSALIPKGETPFYDNFWYVENIYIPNDVGNEKFFPVVLMLIIIGTGSITTISLLDIQEKNKKLSLEKKQLGLIFLIAGVAIISGLILTSVINDGFFHQQFSHNLILQRTSDVNREEIFEIMADVKQYPNVLPHNVSEIRIINQTNNVIFAEETISELGIDVKLLVKHELFPPEQHIIEIMDGAAKNTKIIIEFIETDSKTTITSDISLKASGPLIAIFIFMDQKNFESAYDTVIQAFEDYIS